MATLVTEKLSRLKKAIADRIDLSQGELVKIMQAESAGNQQKMREYFQSNPPVAEFMSIMHEKQSLASADFEKKISDFFTQNPAFKDPAYQKKTYNDIRAVIPEGEHIAVKGGFATLRTERRTGRSPGGTFPVKNAVIDEVEDYKHTKGFVTEIEFLQIFSRMVEYLENRQLYEVNRFAGQGELSIPVRLITEKVTTAAFAINMFRRDPGQEKEASHEGWTILAAPSFLHPDEERFPNGVFKFTDYKNRLVIVGGSGYAGEVKKSMFAIANHMYPLEQQLSFHCSSVYDESSQQVTLIFGLSGTGKSTVAAGMEGSQMLTDDETGLNLQRRQTFNLENGNYYKTGGLLSEPKVLSALVNIELPNVAMYENVVVDSQNNVVFAADPTNNGRVSIPLAAMPGAVKGGMYPLPSRIIILSRDVNAVLDPVNLLSKEQIIYYLSLGYTSKTPGTEIGINKPVPTYSKWEGGPFYDLKDEIIMKLLLKFFSEHAVEGILLNTGEGGGPFGTAHNKRFPVSVSLQLARYFMSGQLSKHRRERPEDFVENKYLQTVCPKNLPGLPEHINQSLNARELWQKNGYSAEYENAARELFKEFRAHAEASLGPAAQDPQIASILKSGPVV